MQPAIGEGRRRHLGLLPVTPGDVGPFHPQFADRAGRRVGVVLAHDAHLHIQHRLAGGAGLAHRILPVEHQHQRARFGHAVALLQDQALFLPLPQDRVRGGGAADAGIDHPAHVGVGEPRMRPHELEVRRHAKQVRDPDQRVADQPQRLPRIEGAHDQHRTAGLECRVGKHVQPTRMEQRQQAQEHGGARHVRDGHAVDRVPEVHPVGDDRTFGPSRGAGRVENGRDVVQRRRHRRIEARFCTRDVFEGRAERQHFPDAAIQRQGLRPIGEIGIEDQHLRGAIGQDRAQFGIGQPPVQRHENRAGPPAGELHVEDIGAVRGQHGDAVAGFDTKQRSESTGQARDTVVEHAIAVVPPGRQVYRRQRVRPPHGVMGDAVIIGNGHRRPPADQTGMRTGNELIERRMLE